MWEQRNINIHDYFCVLMNQFVSLSYVLKICFKPFYQSYFRSNSLCTINNIFFTIFIFYYF